VSAADDQLKRFVAVTQPVQQRLFRIALALCRDPDQAADLTQEALVRAFRSFGRFRRGAPVLPWLARILRNVHLDSFKTGRVRHEVAESRLDRGDAAALANAGGPAPQLEAVERGQLIGWLGQEMDALSPPQRLVLLLCDVEGFSYQEAAEATAVPIGTVRSRLARAREQLRQRLRQRMTAREGTATSGRS